MGAASQPTGPFWNILTPPAGSAPSATETPSPLFFRLTLLPNHTVEVCGVSPRGTSLRLGIGPEARLRRVSFPQGERPEDGGPWGLHCDQA